MICDYDSMNEVMRIIKEEHTESISQDFNLKCKIKLSIRKSKSHELIRKLKKLDYGKFGFIEICSLKQDNITVYLGEGLYVSVVFDAGYLDAPAKSYILKAIKRLRTAINLKPSPLEES